MIPATVWANYSLSAWIAGLLSAACLLTGGCTEVLGPREPYPEPFSVYGILTPDRDTQFVWISPIEEFPSLGARDALQDVTVTSTDLETGQERVWEDSIVVRENGQHEYLYRSPFRAEFGGRYRIEIHDGSSGEQTWADVRVPPPVDVEIVEANRNTVRVHVIGENIRALNTEIKYLVKCCLQPEALYSRVYHGKEKLVDSGWQVDVRFNIDRFWVEAWYTFDVLGIYPISPFLFLGEATLHGLIGDASWDPPGGIFDSRITSQPGVMENVENGTGFIGGGYRIEKKLDIPREVVEAALFKYCSSPWVCPEK